MLILNQSFKINTISYQQNTGFSAEFVIRVTSVQDVCTKKEDMMEKNPDHQGPKRSLKFHTCLTKKPLECFQLFTRTNLI